MDQTQLTANQFGATAASYLSSTVHAAGRDLERLQQLAEKVRPAAALDLGAGAGHVSYALARGGAGRIVAYDVAAPMLDVVGREAASRGHSQIRTRQGRAEELPFADGEFELIVSRFSAHHWYDLPSALAQVSRVLANGGTLVIIDVLSPETALLDTTLQTLELLRDSSHVRNYRESEWRALCAAANLPVVAIDRWTLDMDYPSWVARIGTPPARCAALETVFDALPAEARDYFKVTPDRSFIIDAGWIEVLQPG